MNTNEFTFIWKIENISMCPQAFGECINSPYFTMENISARLWRLSLYPRGNVRDKSNSFCKLTSGQIRDTSKNIDIKIELMDTKYKIFASESKSGALQEESAFYKLVMFNDILHNYKLLDDDTLVIRCHITTAANDTGRIIECLAKTKIPVDRCSFKWNIKYENSVSSYKQFFYTDKNQFQIDFYFHYDEIYFQFNITKLGTAKGDAKFRVLICRIAVLDVNGVEEISKRDISWFSDTKMTWAFPSFIKKREIANLDKYVKNDIFTLSCDFCVPKYETSFEIRYDHINTVSVVAPIETDSIRDLQEDFKRMLDGNVQTDVKLRVNNEIFPAHKCVMSARSPVFCNMFKQDMLEKKSGVVEITDMDAKALKNLLGFLYTGKLDNMDVDSILELLLVADKYQVISLIEECASLLTAAMTDENVCEIISIADMVGHELLKEFAMNYIKLHASVVLCSAEWAQWLPKNAQLATQIFSKFSSILANAI